jgi:probable HAF family extracellular repeat protein
MRIRRTMTLSILFLAFSGVGMASAAPLYNVVDLGTLGGATSKAYDINNRGQVVGYADINVTVFPSSYVAHAFLWQSDSGMNDIGTIGTFSSSIAYGINDSGQVVGTLGYAMPGGYHPFLWQTGGAMQDLGGGDFSMAANINNAGQVVGQSSDYGAFLWQSASGMQSLLGGVGRASDINDNGLVVGTRPIDGKPCGFLWQNGSVTQDIGGGGNDFTTNSINDRGQVVGAYGTYPAYHAFLWQSSTGRRDLGMLNGATDSTAGEINESGQVVGTSGDRAFLWQDGIGMQDLNGLISQSSGWTLESASAINDNGQIVGYGLNSSGQSHAFFLNPIPEPSSLVLLTTASAGALFMVWRGYKRGRRVRA